MTLGGFDIDDSQQAARWGACDFVALRPGILWSRRDLMVAERPNGRSAILWSQCDHKSDVCHSEQLSVEKQETPMFVY